MWDYLIAIILGIVEGITEFVPISSTGHMIIVGNLLGFTGEKADCFEVVIQLGAILAVVFLYWPRFKGLLNFKAKEGFYGIRGLWLLFLTCLPAGIMGVLVYKPMKAYLFHPIPVTIALAVGAIGILLAERFKPQPKVKTLDELSWRHALYVGLFQCFSLWPGMSRSASTIVGGMLSKIDRTIAAEYSFLAAVPIMFAATAKDLYENKDNLASGDVPMFAVGFIVSFIVAAFSIKTFIKLLKKWTLKPFAYYRLIFAVIFGTLLALKLITLAD